MKAIRLSTLGKIVWLLIIFIFIICIGLVVSLFKDEDENSTIEPVSKEEEKVINYIDQKQTVLNFEDEISLESENDVIFLTESQTYKLSGVNDKYNMVINAPNKVVKILFSNFKSTILENLIEIKDAYKVILEFEDSTINELVSLSEDINLNSTSAIINSNSNIEITGKGKLIVNSINNFISSSGNIDYANSTLEILNINTAFNIKGNLKINEGLIYINASSEGIKSAGNLNLEAGRLIVKTLGKPIDVSGIFLVNNGEILLTSMVELQKPNANSLQKSLILNFEKPTSNILVLHDTQKVVMAYKGGKQYQHILYSRPQIEENSYILYSGGSIAGVEEYDLYTKIEDYLEDYQLTAPNLSNATFVVEDLITIYDGVVKKWQFRLSFFIRYNKIRMEDVIWKELVLLVIIME